MKIAIIEPHSDDAFLGVGGYMLSHPENEYFIITIAESPKNQNKSFVLRKFGNIKNVCYGLKNLEKDDFLQFYNAGTREDLEKAFVEKNKITLNGLYEKIRKDIRKYDKLFLPMGFRDGLHNVLSRLKGSAYYREIPYFWARSEWKGAGYKYNEYDYNGVEELKLSDEIFKTKWKIFDTVYKDQLGMFQWFRPYYKTINTEQFYKIKI